MLLYTCFTPAPAFHPLYTLPSRCPVPEVAAPPALAPSSEPHGRSLGGPAGGKLGDERYHLVLEYKVTAI